MNQNTWSLGALWLVNLTAISHAYDQVIAHTLILTVHRNLPEKSGVFNGTHQQLLIKSHCQNELINCWRVDSSDFSNNNTNFFFFCRVLIKLIIIISWGRWLAVDQMSFFIIKYFIYSIWKPHVPHAMKGSMIRFPISLACLFASYFNLIDFLISSCNNF